LSKFVTFNVGYRMLGVNNLSWNIATFNSVLIILNREKDLSPQQLVTIKL